MLRTLEILTPAKTTDLVNIAALKPDLGITNKAEDEYLTEQVSAASSEVCAYLKVPAAQDGTSTILAEDLVETFRFSGPESFGGRLHRNGHHQRYSRLLLLGAVR